MEMWWREKGRVEVTDSWTRSDVSHRRGRTQAGAVVATLEASANSQNSDEEQSVALDLQSRVKNRKSIQGGLDLLCYKVCRPTQRRSACHFNTYIHITSNLSVCELQCIVSVASSIFMIYLCKITL